MMEDEVNLLPIITKIAQQKRKKDRYSIYVDEKYAFSVEEDMLVRYQLTKGKTLTKDEINTITDNDTYHRAYLMAINYLSYRMRSVEEMNTYLQRKEVDPNWIEQIIVTLMEEKLLDDMVFANAYVRDRMHQTSKGPRLIEKELIDKGISIQTAKQATKQYSPEAQFEKALKWLEKERNKKTRHSVKKQEDQLRMKLMKKGFEQEVISHVFNESKPEIDLNREQEIFQKQADKLLRKHQRKLTGFDLKMKMKAALYQKGFQSEMIDIYIDSLDDLK